MASTTPLLKRLSWPGSEPLPVEPGPTRAVLARTFLYLYGAGGMLAIGTLLLPHSGTRSELGVAGPGLAAFGVALAMLVFFERVPMWVFPLLPPAGTVLATIVVWGGGPGLLVPYAAFYFWVVLSSFYLFGARWAWFNVAFVAAAFALVLSVTPERSNRAVSWVMVMGALAVGGAIIGVLRARLERLLGELQVALARTREMVEEESLRRSIEGSERERRRFARELHDQTLQGLASLQMRLEHSLVGEPPAVEGAVRGAVDQIASEVESLRRIIADMRPALLDDLGLGPALDALIKRVSDDHGMPIRARIDMPANGDGGLSAEAEVTVYRAVQEGLANVHKHAGARSAAVDVYLENGTVIVRIEDDGHGFDPAARPEGFGLEGMSERVRLVGGALEVRSDPTGTRLEARLPASRG